MPFHIADDEKIFYTTVSHREETDEDLDWVGGVTVTNHRLMFERPPFRFRMSFLVKWRLLMSWARNRAEMKSLVIGRITSVEESNEKDPAMFRGFLVCLALAILGLFVEVILGILFLILGLIFLIAFRGSRTWLVKFYAGSQSIELYFHSKRDRDELLDAVEGARRATSKAALPAKPRVTVLP